MKWFAIVLVVLVGAVAMGDAQKFNMEFTVSVNGITLEQAAKLEKALRDELPEGATLTIKAVDPPVQGFQLWLYNDNDVLMLDSVHMPYRLLTDSSMTITY